MSKEQESLLLSLKVTDYRFDDNKIAFEPTATYTLPERLLTVAEMAIVDAIIASRPNKDIKAEKGDRIIIVQCGRNIEDDKAIINALHSIGIDDDRWLDYQIGGIYLYKPPIIENGA